MTPCSHVKLRQRSHWFRTGRTFQLKDIYSLYEWLISGSIDGTVVKPFTVFTIFRPLCQIKDLHLTVVKNNAFIITINFRCGR